jgi:hypothetical protein
VEEAGAMNAVQLLPLLRDLFSRHPEMLQLADAVYPRRQAQGDARCG